MALSPLLGHAQTSLSVFSPKGGLHYRCVSGKARVGQGPAVWGQSGVCVCGVVQVGCAWSLLCCEIERGSNLGSCSLTLPVPSHNSRESKASEFVSGSSGHSENIFRVI